jgi:hypothetical protein
MGGAVETGGLKELDRQIRYPSENSPKSFWRLQDSDNSCFLDLLSFCSFCSSPSDNLLSLKHSA